MIRMVLFIEEDEMILCFDKGRLLSLALRFAVSGLVYFKTATPPNVSL